MYNLISKNTHSKLNLKDKIFIAGGKGMVGSAIKRALSKLGYGDESQGGRIYAPAREVLDLTKYNDVEDYFLNTKPDIVIIAAAKVGGIFINSKEPVNFLLENLKIQNNIIEIAYKSNVRRLLFLGSSCIYPKFSKQPIKEEYLLTSSLEPTNEWYALAKIAGLKLCEAYRKQYSFDAISLMPTNLYGPGDNYHEQNSHVIPALIKKFYKAKKGNLSSVQCWGTGSPLREFLHVDDLANACIFALEKWEPSDLKSPTEFQGNPLNWLNVGSESEISIKNLANKISNIFDYNGEIEWDESKPDGTPRKKLDTSKLKKLGWQAEIGLDEGLNRTIKSFLKDHQKIL